MTVPWFVGVLAFWALLSWAFPARGGEEMWQPEPRTVLETPIEGRYQLDMVARARAYCTSIGLTLAPEGIEGTGRSELCVGPAMLDTFPRTEKVLNVTLPQAKGWCENVWGPGWKGGRLLAFDQERNLFLCEAPEGYQPAPTRPKQRKEYHFRKEA